MFRAVSPPETCRALANKEYCATLYIKNTLTMHGHMNVRRMRRRPPRGDDNIETDLKYVASERVDGFQFSQVRPSGTRLLRRCCRCTNCSRKAGNFLGTGL